MSRPRAADETFRWGEYAGLLVSSAAGDPAQVVCLGCASANEQVCVMAMPTLTTRVPYLGVTQLDDPVWISTSSLRIELDAVTVRAAAQVAVHSPVDFE